MKQPRWILALMILGIVGSSVGCNRAAPTEPGGGALQMAAAGSTVSGLSGTWRGTITFHAYSDLEGDAGPSPCDGVESITVTLNQSGQKLTGQFQSGCGGVLEVRGVVAATSLSGSLESPTGPGFGRIFGTVSPSEIQFRTVQLTDDEDDPEGKDNDGDAAFTSSEVELYRSSPERSVPVRVDRARSPRLPSTRR
jgi:hypothetical protein